MPKKVTGIGGVFFKSENPDNIREWYKTHLGFSGDKYGSTFDWRHADKPEKKGYSLWSTFPKETKYFEPGNKEFMINLRVEDLVWLLEELKKEGIEQVGEMQDSEYGKFAHIMDPEGNKIELWEAYDEEDEQTTTENK